MIITRTPYRISFFGGGSDYHAYYSRFGGSVLSCTINKYCHVLLRRMPPFLGTKYRIFWSKSEAVDQVDEIQHAGVRGCLKYLNVDDGIEVNHAGDLPARSGLGSSSSFTVGMLNALHTLQGNDAGRNLLAQQAIDVEQRVLHETVGIQDQIVCAWGGFNWTRINTEGKYYIQPMMLDDVRRKNFEDHLLLVFTGLQRHASQIAKSQLDNFDRNTEALRRIAEMVPQAASLVEHGNIESFGRLLHEAWVLKRGLSDCISNDEINSLYEKALKAGAYGGKLLGAGGGGFFLFVVPPEKRDEIARELGLLNVPVRIENRGSHVVLNDQ